MINLRECLCFCKNMLKICVGVVACLTHSTGWSNTPAQVIERVKIPTNTTLQIISTDSAYNNIQTAMAIVSSTSSVEVVLDFYRVSWGVDGESDVPGFIESQISGWSLISKLDGRNNIVVQLNDAPLGGATGFISVMSIDQQLWSIPNGVFSDLTQISSSRSIDGADISLMRVFGSNASVSATHRNYRDRLNREGWKIMIDREIASDRIVVLSRGSSRLEVSFVQSPSFASAVVVHQVTSK